jgi:hypothetical protein
MKYGPERKISVLFQLFGLILCLSFITGCIEVGNTGDVSPSSGTPSPTRSVPLNSVTPSVTDRPVQDNPPVTVSTVQESNLSGSAKYTDPIPPEAAFTVDHRPLSYTTEDISLPLNYPTAPFFTGTYTPAYTNTGILANVSSPPFVIEFETDAKSSNPSDSLIIITVRDAISGKFIAEEGYNGQYSSESVKRVNIPAQGSYHVNIYGYGATVRLALRGGVPEDKAVAYGVFTLSPLPRTVDYDEE